MEETEFNTAFYSLWEVARAVAKIENAWPIIPILHLTTWLFSGPSF